MKQRNLSTGLVGIALTVACGGATRTSATGTAAPAPEMARDNPFAAARFYVNPEYAAKVEATIAAAPGQAERLRRVEAFPTAVWLNSIATAREASRYLDEALALQLSLIHISYQLSTSMSQCIPYTLEFPYAAWSSVASGSCPTGTSIWSAGGYCVS